MVGHKKTVDMKTLTKLVTAVAFLFASCALAISAFAADDPNQLPESAYNYQSPPEHANFFHGAFAPVIVVVAFIALMYGIYHFWSTGKITDDMK
jgi:hypothetical protein